MPCYLKNVAYLRGKLDRVIKQKGKVPTKAETKQGLKELLRQGVITPAKYNELASKIDACIEVKGHTHDHEHEHVHD